MSKSHASRRFWRRRRPVVRTPFLKCVSCFFFNDTATTEIYTLSLHDALPISEAADHLEEVTLSTGAVVRAWRTKRMIAGQQRDAVVVFSPQLYAGQVRGLHQHLARCGEQLKELGATPRGTPEAVRRKLAQICGRQY